MADEITLEFPDGSKQKFAKGITAKEIAQKIGQRLARDALAAKLDERIIELEFPIEENGKFRILTWNDAEGKAALWHTGAHVLAEAVRSLYKDARNTIGPPIEEGFYQDFYATKPFTSDDFEKIEKKMMEIIKSKRKIERSVVDKKIALEKMKDNRFKQELIEEFAGRGKTITLYTQGDFIDLCKGGHVSNTEVIKAVKLLKVSSAYWRGDAKKESLQRIYGIVFPEQKMLAEYLEVQKKALENSHLKLGRELDLFSMQDAAPGTVFFHPKGTVIYNELIDFLRKEQIKRSYKEVNTPQILKRILWEKSGHWDHYRKNMYFTKIDEEDYAVKPMNCPGHILIYNSERHSYRELPIRIAEFGTVHRHELSGVLNGLFRVRRFTQDDAHIFSAPGQLRNEIVNVIELVDAVYRTFNFEYRVELSTKPSDAMGSDEIWGIATNALKDALEEKKIEYKVNDGDGAFYGPKIDFHIKDSLGRNWQLGTIQVDFSMPEKLGCYYISEKDRKETPVMIHRAIFGSLERFIGILIEHYGGKFPLWIAPVQVVVFPVSDKSEKYAKQVFEKLRNEGIRAELDSRSETVSYKVRDAEIQKVPYILTLGPKEEEKKAVAVRDKEGKVRFGVKVSDFVAQLNMEISEKK